MKYLLLVFFICATLYSSQAKIYHFLQEEYQNSLTAWESLNLKNYEYTVAHFLEGTIGRTKIQVRNGVVVRRTFVESNFFDYPGKYVSFWDEKTPEEIGSRHSNYPYETFAPAFTMDEVYVYCQNEILTQDLTQSQYENGRASVDVFSNGVISKVAFYPNFWENLVFIESIKKKCI